jgi:2,5-diamino-6-(ribosylamino)-4(3H)-pyrimidinone 5'-phosphate reductase
MKRASRPYVICHMVPSVDGRIVTAGWKLTPGALDEYERTAQTFDADAWMIGRISMEPYAGRTSVPAQRSRQPIPRTDHIARRGAASYAIALDPCGRLTWRSGSIDDAHVITVLAEEVSDDYLAFLQAKGVSYLFGGRRKVNLEKVLEKLRKAFGIKRLLLEGGGGINGSFLAADLIDELSVLVAPIADGSIGAPSLFDAKGGKGPARPLKLVSFERKTGGLVWLRYKLRR